MAASEFLLSNRAFFHRSQGSAKFRVKGKLGADTFFLGGLFWPPGNPGPTGQPEKAPPTEREGGSQSLKGGERGELVGRTG